MAKKRGDTLTKRHHRAIAALLVADTFAQAAVIRATRAKRYTDEELLVCLRDLLKQYGELTVSLIDKTPGMPSSTAYVKRFGSMRKAYQCIGYERPGNFTNRESTTRLFRYKAACIDRLVADLRAVGATVTFGRQRPLLVINGEFTVLFVFSRCRDQDAHGDHWAMNLDSNLKPDLTVIMRMARGNEQPLDYFLIPRIARLPSPRFEIRAKNGFVLDAYRFPNLDVLKALCRRTEIKELV